MNEFFEKNPYIKKILLLLWATLALFLLVMTIGKLKEYRFIGSGLAATNTISVTGTGSVEKSPDTAKISFTVEEQSKDIQAAQNVISEKIDAIKKALIDTGIEEKYIKTDSYNTFPIYDYPQNRAPVLRAYRISHSITVSIKNLEHVETVIGILGSNGITTISGPNFGFEDDKAVAREARDKAIHDAKQEAEKLAKALGVRLVRIISYSENGGGVPVPFYQERAGLSLQTKDASAPTVPVGAQKIETTVTVVYEIR